MKHRQSLTLGAVVASSLFAANAAMGTAMSTTTAKLAPAMHAGAITYLSGGEDATQAAQMHRQAAKYPLEFDFVWGRGEKETPIAGVDWSLRNAAGHVLVNAPAGGPVVLASLPAGHYTLTARYQGTELSRAIDVRKHGHETVMLEWPQ